MSAVGPLVAFYGIHVRKDEMVFYSSIVPIYYKKSSNKYTYGLIFLGNIKYLVTHPMTNVA
jgi:hypothetical protein